MELRATPIADLKIIALKKHGDERGFFIERYNADHFAEFGLPSYFPQDNHSRSAPGVLRGLHYQTQPAQGKLVGCIRGHVWDVAVDIRPKSTTFGQHFGLELSEDNGLLLWMPAGFAHGFCVLGNEPAEVLYKVTATYNAAGEGGILWNDPTLKVAWPLAQMVLTNGVPTISARDAGQPTFSEYQKNLPVWSDV